MTPEEAAFERAIAARPGDDLARLVYADWLDEHGRPDEAFKLREAAHRRRIIASPADDSPREEFAAVLAGYGHHDRAEFVRVQVDLARLWPGTACVQCGRRSTQRPNQKYCGDGSNRDYEHRYETTPEYQALKDREAELLAGAWPAWLPAGDTWGRLGVHQSVPPLQVHGHAYVRFRRGFVAEVCAPLAWAWREAECEKCGGTREDRRIESITRVRWDGTYAYKTCPVCHGAGSVSGASRLLRDLCREEPVEHVRVASRRPDPLSADRAVALWINPAIHAWFWYRSDDPRIGRFYTPPHHLPAAVFDRLPGGTSPWPGADTLSGFPTEEAALAAASAAWIALARS